MSLLYRGPSIYFYIKNMYQFAAASCYKLMVVAFVIVHPLHLLLIHIFQPPLCVFSYIVIAHTDQI